MIYKFQVLYRLRDQKVCAAEIVEAETSEDAEGRIRTLFDTELVAVSVGPATPTFPRDWLNVQEQAEWIGVGVRTIGEWKAKGILRRPKLGAVDRISKRELGEFVERELMDKAA